MTLLIGLLVLVFFFLAAAPRESIIAAVDRWRALYAPALDSTADEPALVFEAPRPSWPLPGSPATAQRDEARPQMARRPATSRERPPRSVDDGVATPAGSSDDPGKFQTRERPIPKIPGAYNAQFGI